MWQKDSVEKFLVDRKVKPSVVRSIKARMDEVADQNGMFVAALLDKVMGSYNLAQAYRRAWSQDPSLLAACFQGKKKTPPPKPSQ